MRVSALNKMLAERGQSCDACAEKDDIVQAVFNIQHLEVIQTATATPVPTPAAGADTGAAGAPPSDINVEELMRKFNMKGKGDFGRIARIKRKLEKQGYDMSTVNSNSMSGFESLDDAMLEKLFIAMAKPRAGEGAPVDSAPEAPASAPADDADAAEPSPSAKASKVSPTAKPSKATPTAKPSKNDKGKKDDKQSTPKPSKKDERKKPSPTAASKTKGDDKGQSTLKPKPSKAAPSAAEEKTAKKAGNKEEKQPSRSKQPSESKAPTASASPSPPSATPAAATPTFFKPPTRSYTPRPPRPVEPAHHRDVEDVPVYDDEDEEL